MALKTEITSVIEDDAGWTLWCAALVNIKPVLDLFTMMLSSLTLRDRIFRDPQLKKMQITFAMWHFTCTALVLSIASSSPFNLFVPIRLPFLQMIPLCAFFAAFLILGNLSLAYNSVGFYQYVFPSLHVSQS